MAPSKTMTSTQQIILLALLVVALLACSCSAQNYHYSNGWYAGGKKRSSSSSSASSAGSSGVGSGDSSVSGSDTGNCGMRPEALALIERIVQEEALRMQKACMSSTSSALQEYLESAARKLAGDAKW